MSTYTPCFPPTDTSRLRRPNSSNSSGTSTSGSHASLKVSYSARISQSHLSLASVSEYIRRPPSPTSAAIDIKRVTLIRRKFRLAIDATYRDTSNGKWAHVYEMAKLGSTRGRWQGMCSGSAPHSLSKARKQDHQGIATENADPYPRPPVPVSDVREIRERVENWQAHILPSPLPQVHREDFELNRSTHFGDTKQPSQLNFPIVKQRRSFVAKAMKRKDSPSCKNHSTSRFFRGTADPKLSDTDGVNCDTEAVTTRRPEPCGSNVERALCSRVGDCEHPDTAPKGSPSTETAADQQNIQQVSELFLPPSFPSHLRTSTPPLGPTAKVAQTRLTKPPRIPRNESLCFSASLPSPLPFPLSQAVEENQAHESRPNDSSSPLRHKRPPPDSYSPKLSPNRWHQSPAFNIPHDDVPRRDRDVFSTLSPPEHVPIIDLRQFTQRSRAKSLHSSHGINPMTPRARDKGKDRVMTVDISSSQLSSLSPPWTSRSLAHVPSALLRTPSHSQTNFTHNADAFAHATASTQPPPAKALLPGTDSRAFSLSPGSQVYAETHELPVNEAFDLGEAKLAAR